MIKNIFKRLIPKNLYPLQYVTNRAISHLKGIVNQGPFKGMQYIDEAHVGFVCHKLTGTYEKEIQHIIEHELKISYDVIIDVGSAEGYYSVGMALFSKVKKVISFEGSKKGRRLQNELIILNNVSDKIVVKEFCDPHLLAEEMSKFDTTLLICDVDGYELELLNNRLNPKLNNTTMIIECHNHCYVNMESDLVGRFSQTHVIESIAVRKSADYSDYPNPNLIYRILPKKYKSFPIMETERAQEDTWLYLKPKCLHSS